MSLVQAQHWADAIARFPTARGTSRTSSQASVNKEQARTCLGTTYKHTRYRNTQNIKQNLGQGGSQ